MRSVIDADIILEDPEFHIPSIVPLRADLKAAVKLLRELAGSQVMAARQLRGDSAGVARLKTELRKKHLMPIARHAKVLLKGYPGIKESLRVPHLRADVETYTDATKRMVKALRPHAQAFVAVGIRKTFLADCERAARMLAERDANPDTARSRRSIATRTIPGALRDARDIVAAIDAHVNAELSHNAPLVSKWRSAKRVPGKLGRPRKRKE